jgi:azurin
LSNDNLFWRLTAQRLLVERAKTDVLPELGKLAQKGTDVDYYATLHALWTMDGLKAAKDGEGRKMVAGALKHNAAAVRKASLQIMVKNGWSGEDLIASKLLNDADPGVRLAAINALQDVTPTESIGKTLYELSNDEAVSNDYWLSQAVYVAASMHAEAFVNAFNAAHPEFKERQLVHREAKDFNDDAWKTMALPQPIEKAGEDIDGVIWFRKKLELPSAGPNTSISLGQLDDEGEVWFNGTYIGKSERGNPQKLYDVSPGLIKRGGNTIAVKVEDRGWRGGFVGKPEEMFMQIGTRKVVLIGPWKYEVERVYAQGNENMFAGNSIAERFMENYLMQSSKVVAVVNKEAVVIQLSVIKNQMKYDKTSFEVPAGKAVEIVFQNPDFMQHNLVIGALGSIKIIGAAADAIASAPNGAEMNYVPRIPEVLYSTRLVNPQETVKLSFIAPDKPGEYPFVCTFPGHWSVMNGVMKVVASGKAL